MVTAPAAAIATDPETFPDPEVFDGHRYRRLREQNKHGASALVLGMSTIDSLGFGLGNQACPGRFLAVNNLKLMLARLLAGWELSLDKNGLEYKGPRPVMAYNDFSVVPRADTTCASGGCRLLQASGPHTDVGAERSIPDRFRLIVSRKTGHWCFKCR